MPQTTRKCAATALPLGAFGLHTLLPLLVPMALAAGCAQPGTQGAGLASLQAWRPHVALDRRGPEQLEQDRLECAQRAAQTRESAQPQPLLPRSQSLSTAVVDMRSCLISRGYVLLN